MSMSETDLKVIAKAKELAVHSFKLTSNCNRYPKKYRHSLVDRIQLKSLDLNLNGKTQIFPLKNGVSYLGFHTYISKSGKPIRKLKNQNKRNAQRKFLRMAKLAAVGELPQRKFEASYGAWKNHISHGDCLGLANSMDNKLKEIFIGR